MRASKVSSLFRAGAALSLALAIAACTQGGQFDPTEVLSSEVFNTKKKVQGEREPLFPNGVPGAENGVPADLVKGYQPPPEPAQADAGNPAAAKAAAAEEKSKPKPKPKPKVARAPATAAPTNTTAPAAPATPANSVGDAIWDQRPAMTSTPAPQPPPSAQPAPPAQAQSNWPASPAAQPGTANWPAAPPTKTQ